MLREFSEPANEQTFTLIPGTLIPGTLIPNTLISGTPISGGSRGLERGDGVAHTAALKALTPGPYVTLQDGGRRGYQRFGVSGGGAMDRAALAAANALVGDPAGNAALEFAYAAGEWLVEAESCRIAVTGGGFAASADGVPLATYRSHLLRRGQRLAIGGGSSSVWGYLAVARGFDAPLTLGSRSTHLRAGLGGFAGRAILPGDRLHLNAGEAPAGPERSLRAEPASDAPIRVVLGPQDDFFTPAAIEALTQATFSTTRESDRMGYRLTGPRLDHAKGYNIVSDGVVAGSIQVPGTGQPIVLLMDRQPTGGYPKIATVIGCDLARIAQLRPDRPLRFEAVDVERAQRLACEFADRLDALPDTLRVIGPRAPQRRPKPFWLRAAG